MLKKIRIAAAAVFFVGITLLFLNLAAVLQPWLGWMPKIQFLPAVMALDLGVIIALVLLTLLFGRFYCSVVCPMGVFQDVVSLLSARRKGKKARFRWSPEVKWLRYGVWVLFVAALIAGVHAFVSLLAPYSAYGRMVQTLFAPAHLWSRSVSVVVIAIVTLVAVAVLAWRGGRTYCNTICPVGTTLSFFSRFALFRPVIDSSKCRNCHACERHCKASCIRIPEHTIDSSRCVDCFDCLDNCKFGAIRYRFAYAGKTAGKDDATASPGNGKSFRKAAGDVPDSGRRAFAISAVAAAGALTAEKVFGQAKKLDGGLAEIIPKQKPERTEVLTPFGSKGVKEFYRHCTACQLCVSACPNNVLRPSTDLSRLMQPEMSYERGYCRPECVKCSQVCPAGAILPITPEEKTALHVGTAVVDRDLCVVNRDGVSCGNCARHCPVGAILMVRKDPDNPDSLRIPAVNEERCIGCGACEYLCPSRPISAIHVNGRTVHARDGE